MYVYVGGNSMVCVRDQGTILWSTFFSANLCGGGMRGVTLPQQVIKAHTL